MKNSFHAMLRNVFAQRSRARQNYSMRAFARDLGLAPSTMSDLLKGQKGLSPIKAKQVAKALKFPAWQAAYFCDLVMRDFGRSKADRKKAAEAVERSESGQDLQLIGDETTRAIASPMDLAILECTYLKSFKPSMDWLAKTLSVPIDQVRASVQRLISVGLLEIHDDGGSWKDLSPYLATRAPLSSAASQRFYRSTLKILNERVPTMSVDDKKMRMVVFSLKEAQVAEVSSIVDEALSKIFELCANNESDRDHVLCFSSQLFYFVKGTD